MTKTTKPKRPSFSDFTMTEVIGAVRRAGEARARVNADAARKHALGSSARALAIAKAQREVAEELLDRLYKGYSSARRMRGRRRSNLDASMRLALQSFYEKTRGTGQSKQSQWAANEELLDKYRADDLAHLSRCLEEFLAGYTAPPEERWSARHPLLFGATMAAIGAVLGQVARIVAGQ